MKNWHQIIFIGLCVTLVSTQLTPAEQAQIMSLETQVDNLVTRVSALESIKVAPNIIRTPWIKNFKVSGNKIAGVGFLKTWRQIIMDRVIGIGQEYTYFVKLVATQGRWIAYGFVDIEQQIDKVDSWKTENSIIFFSRNGAINYNDGTGRKFIGGSGIRPGVGDTIEITANTATGLVQWKRDGVVIAQVTSPILKDQTRTWAPYLEFFNEFEDEVNEAQWWEA